MPKQQRLQSSRLLQTVLALQEDHGARGPRHRSARSISQAAVLQMQQQVGNAATCRILRQYNGFPAKSPIVTSSRRTDSSVIQKWNEGEHLILGEAAGVKQVIVHPGDPKRSVPRFTMPFAEIVPFGDYYASFDDMRKDAETAKGRRKINYLRWEFRKDAGKKAGPSPKISAAEKKETKDLYLKLASQNVSHFVTGDRARDEYRKYHEQALRGAFLAGTSNDNDMMSQAQAKEAFGMHFFTDAFSAGHVRVPRQAIKTWYDTKFPKAFDKFLTALIHFMADQVSDEYIRVTHGRAKGDIEPIVKKMAGPYKGAFSLGDIIGRAVHDAEGQGLDVVSSLSPSLSSPVAGHKWKAVGDAQLLSKKGADAKKITEVAVNQSKTEVDDAFKLGQKQIHSSAQAEKQVNKTVSKAFPAPYLAEGFMPKPAALQPSFAAKYPWQWGKFTPALKKLVTVSIKKAIIPQMKAMKSNIQALKIIRHWSGTMIVHPRRAFERFVDKFEKGPIKMLEQIIGKKSTP